jgi:hypothetical protein
LRITRLTAPRVLCSGLPVVPTIAAIKRH